jgi:hypothetical protein
MARVRPINDKGAIVGYYLNAAGGHGFLYNGGVYTTLDRKSPPLPFQEWPLSRLDVTAMTDFDPKRISELPSNC